ncbi:MAG: GspE/PulE family protein [bacterium]
MRIPDSLVEKILNNSGKFSSEQINGLKQQESEQKKPLQDLVISNNLLSEIDFTKLYANEIDVPYTEIKANDISIETLKKIPEEIARQYNAVVFKTDENGTINVALQDPDDVQTINFLQKQLGSEIKVFIAPKSMIQEALDLYRDNIANELTKVIQGAEDNGQQETVSEDPVDEDSAIAKTVNILIDYGVKAGASDIHIEPREDFVTVRYRIDGVLKEANKLPLKILGSLVSRIKILSNLKIDEHRAPQDGRFKVEVGGQVYALRVSTMPVLDGEKVALRILNESSKPADFKELGFWGSALQNLSHSIAQPHGMVLVTGPTGSGKSTTLFSILSKLNTPNINIATVEDPVEYHIIGANQTQVNAQAKMTFANGLRALLRQDPNIIMVGEVRDSETADLAIQAALTGHLVFSTLHTNNAATGLPRLLDMHIEPFLIASTIRSIVGQRLVRKVCQYCSEAYTPDGDMLIKLGASFNFEANGGMTKIHDMEVLAAKDGIGASEKVTTETELSSSSSGISRLWRASDEGCDECNHTGFKGRIGIYEVLNNSPQIQKMIVGNSTSEAIQQTAISEGMLTMQIDGLIKSLRGLTTIEEVLRVTVQE